MAKKIVPPLWIHLYAAAKPYSVRMGLCICFGILARFTLLFQANIIGQWADDLWNPQKEAWTLSTIQYLWILVFMNLFSLAFMFLYRMGLTRMSLRSLARLHDAALHKLSRLPLTHFDINPLGRTIQHFSSDYLSVTKMGSGPFLEPLTLAIDMCLYVVLISIANYHFLPLVFIAVTFQYLTYRRHAGELKALRHASQQSRAPSVSHLAELVQGRMVVRLYQKNDIFKKMFVKKIDDFLNKKHEYQTKVSFFSLKLSTSSLIALGSAAIYGMFLIQKGLVSLGTIGVIMTLLWVASSTIQSFFEWLLTLEDAIIGAERLNDYLVLPLESGTTLCPPLLPYHKDRNSQPYKLNQDEALPDESLPSLSHASISFEKVTMSYRNGLAPTLQEVSFLVEPGEKCGIIGASGSGKSSLIQALFHLYPLQQGQIRVGGYAPALPEVLQAHTLPLEKFRRLIALITQEPVLFEGTLGQNIGLEGELDDRVTDVLRSVGLSSMIKRHPRGAHQPILEKGANLSAGEKQLICMARCILQDAPVVIMDEATSALDPKAEALLAKISHKFFQHKTQLIIAHRLATVQECDSVIWMEKGRLIAKDKPEVILPEFQKKIDKGKES